MESNLHSAIFQDVNSSYHFMNDVILKQTFSQVDKTIRKVAQQNEVEVKSFRPGGSVEATVTFEWDGKEKKSTFEVSGEVHDDKGNYIEADIRQDSDGKISGDVTAGHEEDR